MPEWFSHSQNFRRFLRRWGVGGQNLYEILSGVLPVAVVDRSWQDDSLDLWGVAVPVSVSAPPPNKIPAVAIASPPTLDTYIRQIDAFAFATVSGQAIGNQAVAVYTPQDSYNPVLNGLSQFSPALFASRGNQQAQTLFFGGDNPAFPVPVPPAPFSPPIYMLNYSTLGNDSYPFDWQDFSTGSIPPAVTGQLSVTTVGVGARFIYPKSTRVLSMNEPGIRIPAGGYTVLGGGLASINQLGLAVQLNAIPSVAYTLVVSFLFTEGNALEF